MIIVPGTKSMSPLGSSALLLCTLRASIPTRSLELKTRSKLQGGDAVAQQLILGRIMHEILPTGEEYGTL